MRVLHITSHLNVGGVTSAVISLSHGLAARGHAITIASDSGTLEPWVARAGAEHWRAPLHTSFEFNPRVWAGARQLSDRLRQHPVDVVHAHTRVGQVVAQWLAQRHRIPYVATWHGVFRPNLGRRVWPCTGDMTIAISEMVRRHLINDMRVSAGRIALIHNGVDVARFAQAPAPGLVEAYRRRWDLAREHPVVGIVGRMASGGVKGYDLFLRAVSLVRRQLPELTALLVGDGPRRRFLEQEAGRLGIRDAVRFTGTAEDVCVPLAAMDAFAFSSRQQEGFGLALVEAMAASRPVIAFRVGAVPEIIRDGQDGLLAAPQDTQAMADGIVRLCRDRQLAARLGAAARQRVAEAFSLERMVCDVEAVYERVVAEQACSR